MAQQSEETTDVEILEEPKEGYRELPVSDTPARILAGVMGLLGFATAALVGLWVGNPGVLILGRALVAMLVCSVLGRLIGYAGFKAVSDFLERYKEESPVPEMPESLQKIYKEEDPTRVDREIMRKSAA